MPKLAVIGAGSFGVARRLVTDMLTNPSLRDSTIALLLNYTNPMTMLSRAILDTTGIRYVGLCHSVQGTAQQLADYVGLPFSEVSYTVAGINHMAWFLDFRHKGPTPIRCSGRR